LHKFIIDGGKPLIGEVNVSGAKNSAVAIIPATLLIDGGCTIENVPNIGDVKILITALRELGVKIECVNDNSLFIDASNVNTYLAPYRMIQEMRASYYLLGALLGRFGKAEVSFPGGCDFGIRPIDQHIKGLEALGAKIEVEHGLIKATAQKLVGAQIYMDVVSVGATVNLMLAAVKAEGLTIIENAAKEPHVVDTANFLNAMGANIKGAGTDIIKIRGVTSLSGKIVHPIIPDQIEAGTFMIAAAVTNGDITVRNVIPKHMESVSAKLTEMNMIVTEGSDWIRVTKGGTCNRVNIKTLPYPGFPTDLHPPISVLLCLTEGTSILTEGVWDLRFQYVDELKRMGADIKVEGRACIIEGIKKLTGARLNATDLRAGAALTLAGLMADGKSELYNVKYIDRGYENFEEKLKKLGANIYRVPIK